MAEKTKGRAWISSLKPVWTKKSMEKLAKELKGSAKIYICLLYTSPSPRDVEESRMPSSA